MPISSTDSEMTSKNEKGWETGLLLRVEARLRLQHKQVYSYSADFSSWRRQSPGKESRPYQQGAICHKSYYDVLKLNIFLKILNSESIKNALSKRLFAIFRSLMHFKVIFSHYEVWNHKVWHGRTITKGSSIIQGHESHYQQAGITFMPNLLA